MAKILKKIFDVIFVLMIVLLSLYFVLRFLGMAEIYKVQTGSMEDGIHAGDYILIYKKDKYSIGDVVTYEKDGYHVTHRIIKKNGDRVITKGDANNVEDDEISVKSIVGEVAYNGGILNFLINYKYALASALLALYLFSCYFGRKEDEKNLKDKEEDKTLDDDLVKEEVLNEEESKIDDSEEKNSEEEESKIDDSEEKDLEEVKTEEDEKVLKDEEPKLDNSKKEEDLSKDKIDKKTKGSAKKKVNKTKSSGKLQTNKSTTKKKTTKKSSTGKKKIQSKK
ncbi:MAG: signal peptidase I [Bacilli bacterium]|nr:signal peptidase I [Bacilli bacterium]